MPAPHTTPFFVPDIELINCPTCGQYTKRNPVTFYSGAGGRKASLRSILAPFIKEPQSHGHVCECCRNIFGISRGQLPAAFYVWVFLLICILGAIAIIVCLLLFGS